MSNSISLFPPLLVDCAIPCFGSCTCMLSDQLIKSNTQRPPIIWNCMRKSGRVASISLPNLIPIIFHSFKIGTLLEVQHMQHMQQRVSKVCTNNACQRQQTMLSHWCDSSLISLVAEPLPPTCNSFVTVSCYWSEYSEGCWILIAEFHRHFPVPSKFRGQIYACSRLINSWSSTLWAQVEWLNRLGEQKWRLQSSAIWKHFMNFFTVPTWSQLILHVCWMLYLLPDSLHVATFIYGTRTSCKEPPTVWELKLNIISVSVSKMHSLWKQIINSALKPDFFYFSYPSYPVGV